MTREGDDKWSATFTIHALFPNHHSSSLSSGTMKEPLLNMRDSFWDSHSVFGCEPSHLLTFVTDSETWAFKKMDDKFKC